MLASYTIVKTYLQLVSSSLLLRGQLDKFRWKCHFFCEKLSLGFSWLHIKRLCGCEHGKPPEIESIHTLHLLRLWGRFSRLSVFSKLNLLKKVELSQRWLAYQNRAERIRNKRLAPDFSFSAPFFFFVIWTLVR